MLLKKSIAIVCKDLKLKSDQNHDVDGNKTNATTTSFPIVLQRQLLLLMDALKFDTLSKSDATSLRDFYLQFTE